MKHKSLLIFGGTFDPVHLGHLGVAAAVQKKFHFSSFIFLPCKIPVLKGQAKADTRHRLNLLKCALEEYPIEHAEIDAREINRDSPSFMATTLADFRKEQGHSVSISLLMGEDVFASFTQWYEWQNILQLCNILIIKRQHPALLSQELTDLLAQHLLNKSHDLLKSTSGGIYLFDAGTYPISSTAIRVRLSQGLSTGDLPKNVANYIAQNHLYLG